MTTPYDAPNPDQGSQGQQPGTGAPQRQPPQYGQAPQYPQAPQYGQAAPPGAYQPAAATTDGFAITSLVLGLLGLWGVGSILAIVFSVLAKKRIAVTGAKGSGMATAGLVLGIIGVVGYTLLVIGLVSS